MQSAEVSRAFFKESVRSDRASMQKSRMQSAEVSRAFFKESVRSDMQGKHAEICMECVLVYYACGTVWRKQGG